MTFEEYFVLQYQAERSECVLSDTTKSQKKHFFPPNRDIVLVLSSDYKANLLRDSAKCLFEGKMQQADMRRTVEFIVARHLEDYKKAILCLAVHIDSVVIMNHVSPIMRWMEL